MKGVPEEMAIMDAGKKVILAGIWLIRNGYGNMMILPYVAPSGAYWRCEFHPVWHPSKAFYRYSTGNGTQYLADHCGGTVRREISTSSLGKAIMKSVPEHIKEACEGRLSDEMRRWLEMLELALDSKYLPRAFHEYKKDDFQWDLVSVLGGEDKTIAAPPEYVSPGKELSITDDEYWLQGEHKFDDLIISHRDGTPLSILDDEDRIYEIAQKLKYAMSLASTGHETAELLKCAIGNIFIK